MRAVSTEQVTFKSININDIKYTDNREKQRKKQIYAVLNRFKKAIQIMEQLQPLVTIASNNGFEFL